MRIKRLVLAAGLTLIAAGGAIVIAAHVLVPRLVANLAESVRDATGRELSVGETGVRLLPSPAVTLRRVRFANAASGSQPWLVQADRVDVQIAVAGLLSHRLHIRKIELRDASVLIETDAGGKGNWVLASKRAATAGSAWLDGVELDLLASRALTLSYHDGVSGATHSLQLDALDIAAPMPSQPMRVRAEGAIDVAKVTATGTIGPVATLLANAAAYPVDLDCNIGAASIGVHGTIGRPLSLGGFNLTLRAQAPDVSAFAALAGASVPSLGPVAATASVTGSTAAVLFKDIAIEAGSAEQMRLAARGDLQGSASAAGTYEWSSTGIDLVAEGRQLGDLAAWIDRPAPALGAFRIGARVSGTLAAPSLSAIDVVAGGDGMPKITLSGSIRDVRSALGIDLKINAKATGSWRLDANSATRLPPFLASVRLHESEKGYRLDELELKVAESSVKASLQVARIGSRLNVTGKVKLPVIDLARHAADNGGRAAATATARSRPSTGYWNIADADLDLSFDRLVLPSGRQVQEGGGHFALANGHLRTSALQATFAGAKLQVDGSIADPYNLTGLDLKVALQGKELAELFGWFGMPIARAGSFNASATLRDTVEATPSVTTAGTATATAGSAAPTAKTAPSASAGPQRGFGSDDLQLGFGRSSARGRFAFVPGEPRPRLTFALAGPLLDLSILSSSQQKSDGANPFLFADVDADLRFDRIVLPDRRELGPVRGGVRLVGGALEFKQLGIGLEGTNATLDGTIDAPMQPSGIAVAVDLEASSGVGIATFTSLPSLRQLPAFRASGKIADVPDGFAVTGLKLAFPATTISGDVSLTRGAQRFKLQAKTTSTLLDFTTLQRATAPAGAAKPAASAARMIPELTLPLDLLRAIDADLDLRIDAVKLGDAANVGPLQLRATITDGRLNADPVELSNGADQVLHAALTADAAQATWTFRLTAGGIDLGQMLARFGKPQLVTGGSIDVDVGVRGRGTTLPAILGSLDGNVRLSIGPNRINNVAVDVGSGIIARLFSAANPFKDTDPDTQVKCIAVRMPAKAGVLKSEHNAAIETAKYNLIATGTVNLGTETFDLAVTPVVTGGLGLIEIPTVVSLSGTFSAPSVGLTAGGAMKSAASIGATIAVPGLSNLAGSLFRKITADHAPCATALQE